MRNAYRLRELGHMSNQSEDKILKLKKTYPQWRSEGSFEHVRQRKNIGFNILFHKQEAHGPHRSPEKTVQIN